MFARARQILHGMNWRDRAIFAMLLLQVMTAYLAYSAKSVAEHAASAAWSAASETEDLQYACQSAATAAEEASRNASSAETVCSFR